MSTYQEAGVRSELIFSTCQSQAEGESDWENQTEIYSVAAEDFLFISATFQETFSEARAQGPRLPVFRKIAERG